MKVFFLAVLLLSSPLAFSWVVNVEKDKMTDEKWHYISVKSLNTVWAKRKAELTIAHNCTKVSTRIFLSHPYLVGNSPVEIRLDKDQMVSEYASPSQSKKVLFIGDESTNLGSITAGHPKNLIKKWVDHQKLLIQYETINKGKEVAEFNISGLKKEIEKFCN